MPRIARETVLVGGVIYLAGQAVPDVEAAKVTADVWANEPKESEQKRTRRAKE